MSDRDHNFNRDSHPERRPDEVFICNLAEEPDDTDGILFTDINWNTKRKGQNAYSVDGDKLSELYPVFATITEIEGSEGGFEILERLQPRP